jgi:hypothetical protein
MAVTDPAQDPPETLQQLESHYAPENYTRLLY